MEARAQETKSERARGVPGSDQKEGGRHRQERQEEAQSPSQQGAKTTAKMSGTSGDGEQVGSHRPGGSTVPPLEHLPQPLITSSEAQRLSPRRTFDWWGDNSDG